MKKKVNRYQGFSKQLTNWMAKKELKSCIVTLHKHRAYENVYYIVKSDRHKIRPSYAIFIKPENQLRRKEDLRVREAIRKYNLLYSMQGVLRKVINDTV